MKKLISVTPFEEMSETLEALDQAGLTRNDLAVIRSDRPFAVAVATYAKQTDPFFRFDKVSVRSLIELIAGGERKISGHDFRQWRPLLMFAIRCMHTFYDTPPEGYEKDAEYYGECWGRLNDAVTEEELIDAVEFLRLSIQQR